MKRREFITQTAYGLGAAWLGSKAAFPAKLPGRISATDTVTLGKTGIKTSRLAMGTGTVGVGHHSHQTALGVQGLSDLLWHGSTRDYASSIWPIPTAATRTLPSL